MGIPTDCLYGAQSSGPVAMPVPGGVPDAHEQMCQPLRDAFYGLDNRFAGRLFALLWPLPLLSGLLLGVPLVGREIEWGTAPLAWTLGRSRGRWLLARALPLAAILAGLLVIPALAAEVLESARAPFVDPGASFDDYGLRTGLVVVRGLLAFGLGLAVGAFLGRQLPGLIVAGVLTVLLLVVAGELAGPFSALARSLATWRPQATDGAVVDAAGPGALFFAQGARDRATGEVVPFDRALVASGTNPGGTSFDDTHFEMVSLVLPGARYVQIASIEGLATGALAGLALVVTLLVVDRRRPS